MELRRSIIKDTFKYLSGSYIARVISLVNGIAIRRFLGPSMMGVWSLVQVILTYLSYVSLGTTSAAVREIAFFRGKNDHEHVEKIKNQVMSFCLIGAVGLSVAIFIYCIVRRGSYPRELVWGMVFISIYMVVQRVYDFYAGIMRAYKKFNIISKLVVIEAVISLLMTFLMVRTFKLYGLYIASLIVILCNFWYVRKNFKYDFKFHWDPGLLKSLLKIGFPIMIMNIIFTLFRSVDRIVISKMMGFTMLGYYSVALMADNYIRNFPLIFSVVFYPRIQEGYSQNTTPEGISKYLIMPVIAMSYVMFLLIGLGCLWLPALINVALPQYILGITAMKILIFGSFFSSISHQAKNYLITLNKQVFIIPLAVFMLIANILLDIWMIKIGWGVAGVAFATFLVTLVNSILLLVYALGQFQDHRKTIYFILKIFSLFVYFSVVIIGIVKVLPLDLDPVSLFFRTVLFALFYIPVAFYMEKKTHILQNIWQLIRRKA